MIFPDNITDIHTHRLPTSDAIRSIDPNAGEHPPVTPFSVGILPLSGEPDSTAIANLEQWATMPNALAIGEAGLDTLHSPLPVERQIELFRRHYELSERLAKPLIIHCVKAWSTLIGLHNLWKPTQPWIIHGFRGKPQLARQLLDHGFYLSFGLRYNQESYDITPLSRRFRETD